MPRAGLLGSLTAIALVLISFLPLLDIAAQPVAGHGGAGLDAGDADGALAVSAADSRVPWGRWSSGCLVYYGMHLLGWGPGWGARGGSIAGASGRLAAADRDWLDGSRSRGSEAVGYLPVAIPLALATVVGGIDCTESAAAAGDDIRPGRSSRPRAWRHWSAACSAA